MPADLTHGAPTTLPWGIDFGDGVPRHPVPFYESIAMSGFAWRLERRCDLAIPRGFHRFALDHGTQRFLWEFLEPYATVPRSFDLFHLAGLARVAYALVMMHRHPVDVRSQPARL